MNRPTEPIILLPGDPSQLEAEAALKHRRWLKQKAAAALERKIAELGTQGVGGEELITLVYNWLLDAQVELMLLSEAAANEVAKSEKEAHHAAAVPHPTTA